MTFIGVVIAVLVVAAFGMLAYLISVATRTSTARMRGGSHDQRRADDGGPGSYSDYTSPMG